MPFTYSVPVDVLKFQWKRQLVPHRGILEYKPQEWASAAIDSASGVIFIGSSTGVFNAIDMASGHIRWSFRAQGGIASTPLYWPENQTVYFGANDGRLYAINASTGREKWHYSTQGAINHAPVFHNGLVLFTNNEGRIYAIDAQRGSWRWQYEREMPEGFTIQGYAGVTIRDSIAYTGFADGTLVALRATSGDVIWTRSLAGGKTQFLDVDTTPLFVGNILLAASYASGVYAISSDNNSVQWHYPIEGVTRLSSSNGTIYFSAPKIGITALDLYGKIQWQQVISKGIPAAPVPFNSLLFITGTEVGLSVISANSGKLLQYYDPRRGLSAIPAVKSHFLVVLSNEGWLYGFRITG